jgi:glycosyltransferase involved in cell wall biosynthesis
VRASQRNIRLFVPTGIYPPEIGGPATYVPLLEKHLPKHGFFIDVLPFSSVKHFPKGIAHFAYFFHCVSHSMRADIVYAQDAVSVGFPARLAAFITRRPFLVKIVGDHVWEQGRVRFGVRYELDDFTFWPINPYLFFLRVLQQIVVRSAKKVIVPSAYLRSVVLKWGITDKRIDVIYNGVEIPVIVQEPKTRIERPLIVSVGRLTPWKGFKGVIDAIAGEQSWNLTIVGDGPMRQELESYAKSKGVGERVHFTGLLPREELHWWLKVADVFVLNSTYEGLPHVLVEAMSLETPVVASDIPGNREVVEHDKNGILVSPHDSEELYNAIVSTLGIMEKTKRRVESAKVRADEFSVEQTISGLAQILKTL